MLTIKENYLIAARGGKPQWVPNFSLSMNMYEPAVWAIDPVTGLEWTGARWLENEAGLTADTVNPPLSSILEWREKVIFPDLSKIN